MMITIRKAAERGQSDFGWLDSRHSFSFGAYQDPAHMGFRSLRVINDDRVAGGGGFSPHPHRNMEIFSYVLQGQLEHKDSMGNARTLHPGEVQLMSAGSGVTHSEYNPSPTEPTRFLQIWIEPNRTGLTPGYTEWRPTPEQADAAAVLIISPDGRDGSATIHQDALVYRIQLPAGASSQHTLATGRGLWLQMMTGAARLNDQPLAEGDGAHAEEAATFVLEATEPTEALLFDLA